MKPSPIHAALFTVLTACAPANDSPANTPPIGVSVAAQAPTATGMESSAPPATSSVAPGVPTPPPQDDVARSNQFGVALLQKVTKAEENVFISPPNLRAVLAMVTAGARGKTASELDAAVFLDADPNRIAAAAKAERESLKADVSKDLELASASRLYADRSMKLEKSFLDLMKSGFDAPMESVDFATAPDVARTGINAWVKKSTRDKIPELLPSRSIDGNTRVVAVSAMYMKGLFAEPFDKARTKDVPWITGPIGGKPRSVAMMTQSARFKFAHVGDAKLALLPYGKGNVGLVIVLPDAKTAAAVTELEAKLDHAKIAAWQKALDRNPVKVDLSLPRFEFHFGGSMKPALTALGVHAAFGGADFSGIAPEKDLVLSDVFHQTYVKVDETGTEAAAASGAVANVTSVEMSEEFLADHPFLFFIEETKTGRILFLGHVVQP